MKYDIALVQRGGDWWLKAAGRGRARRVCTVAEACARLRRGRRQVYRLIGSEVLPARGKVFGEWLLDRDSVERLARSPLTRQPVPARLQVLFPEYDLASLNVGRDSSLIVTRVLDRGTRAEVRWLNRRLPRKVIVRCIEEDGARLMSRRALRLWSLYFGVEPRPLPEWRTRTNPWLEAGH